MPFEIVFEGAKEFAQLIDTASKLIDEAAFKVTEDGISMRAMDPSRVVLIDLNLPSSIFSKYEVVEPETIGVNMDHLKKILKRGKAKDTLILKKGEENFLEITIQGTATRTFRVPLIDVEEMEVDLPELPFTAKVVVLGEVLKDAVKDASLVSDSIKFIARENEFIMKAEGETQEVEIKLTLEDEGLLDIEVQEETKSAYGVSYLSDMVKGLGKADEVTIKFGNEMPMQMEYYIRDEGRLTFLLAPRVEE
ncbi:DNA polymerase III sliding clamp [Pyrococcus furiosus DSM 3638]|uniref:DNA polymerase sliding clamp n=3 Tax=Pyrococcus furiosus TaxID=2261 RepID=PCNA_PYRFU|nr:MULTISPECIES: DNA polymerase sliding clamp [Pyrococcus]O73947.2 RecName: Full=DNA polymerase sliding clamp; AltName: Full=Proliferating cell nuclear antigen homolog; Short=PCNA [Pyrococcus furiosus DSM 3638]BAA33020.2 proliferation cell nuclear antigen [Pyrococcus furiosus]AAL81107.1 pcna sliding clamp (proliferating-cell nuclear antigen) [Pyrococcus furiosus DSM 3638]AFN03778.1 DNA polymerase sliding clamp [Pyrococcus furiosus COM1]MDK2869836.1 proliferating cell nuclear antigen [Pyrococcu